MTKTAKSIFLFILTALALLLLFIVSPYWSFSTDLNFLLVKESLITHPIWMPVFYIHLFAGSVSILVGVLQFFGFSQKRRVLHKILGRSYAYAILLLGVPTGLYMAFFAEGGWLSTIGFVLMSVLWFYTTITAIIRVKNGDIAGHKAWMIRSYAVTFSAVTLRLWVPFCSYFLDWDHNITIVATAWMSWGINLLAAEAIIRTKLRPLRLFNKFNVQPNNLSS